MNQQVNQVAFSRNLVVIGLVLGCIIIGFFVNPLIVWGMFATVITAIIFLGHPPQLLFMYWFWMTVVASLLQIFTPSSVFGLVPEAMLAAVGGLAVLAFCLRTPPLKPEFSSIVKVYLILLGVIASSILLNGLHPKNLVMSFTEYYGFFLVFLATAIYVNPMEKLMRFMVKVAMIHLILCVILNILGFLGLNPIVANRIIFDKAIGTFSSQGAMGFYSIAIMFLSLNMVVHLEKGRERSLWLFGLGLSFFSFFITFSFHAYVYVVALYVLSMILFRTGRSLKVGIAVLALVFFLLSSLIAPALMGLGRDEFDQSIMGQLTDTQYVRDRIEMIQDSPKMEVFRKMLIYNFMDSPKEWWIGNGPGMGMGTVGVKYVSPKAWEYLQEYYYTYTGASSMSRRSALQSPHNGLYALWSDIGFIGTVAYIGIYVFAALHLLNNLRKNLYTNPHQQVLAETCVLWLAFLVSTNFMSDTFYRHELLGGLWIFTALVWRPFEEPKVDEKVSAQTAMIAPLS